MCTTTVTGLMLSSTRLYWRSTAFAKSASVSTQANTSTTFAHRALSALPLLNSRGSRTRTTAPLQTGLLLLIDLILKEVVYVCQCMYVSMYVCLHVYAYMCACVCVCVCVCIVIIQCMCVCVCVCIYHCDCMYFYTSLGKEHKLA